MQPTLKQIRREQPLDIVPEGPMMIVKRSPIDEIASRIDVSLCDAGGAIRMLRDREDQDPPATPGEVTAVLLSQVRRDIGNLAGEVRSGFSTLESRVRDLELKDARSDGAISGIKGTMAVIAAVCTIFGGFIGWLVSLLTRGTKP